MTSPIHQLNDIDVRRLRVFMAVVESGSFVAAQYRLGLSEASISLHMSGLEERLDAVLCKRGRSGFSLTPEGERIYVAAQQLMLAHDRFKSSVGEAKGKLIGDLKLGVIDNSVFDSELEIPRTLSKFRVLAPEVRISLYTMPPSELEQAILEQQLHLAIGVFYEYSQILDYQVLCHENLTLYCGKEHPLFRLEKSKVKLSLLKLYDFVERTYGATLNRLNKPVKFKTAAYTSSLEATLLLILSGGYIGFLPRYYADQWVKQEKIKPIFAKELFIKTEVCVLTHKNPENAKMTNALKQLILNDTR